MRPLQRTGARWAALAAFGAAYLVTGGALAALQLAVRPLRDLEMALTDRTIVVANIPESVVQSLALALGALAAGVVARRAGGVKALAAFATFLALGAGLRIASAIERQARLRSDGCCLVLTVNDVPALTAAIFVPAAIALVAGAAMARTAAGGTGVNAASEAAGAYALAGIAAMLAMGFPASWLIYASYATPGVDALPHAVTVVLQSAAAAVIFARRAGELSPGVLGTLALCGLAAVAYADVIPISNTLFLDWTYVPVSLAAVPLASAVAGAAVIVLLRPFRGAVPAPPDGG